MTSSSGYRCPKCQCITCDTDQIRVFGGFWSSFFD
ncbi:MAG: zinc ribbon domain-containing protein, partial [Prochlorococcus sp.]